jgi:hypothetical protein
MVLTQKMRWGEGEGTLHAVAFGNVCLCVCVFPQVTCFFTFLFPGDYLNKAQLIQGPWIQALIPLSYEDQGFASPVLHNSLI